MATKRYQLENYRKHLLNRVNTSSNVIEYIESCLASDDEAAPHTFHKVMVHNWTGNSTELFETLSEYFSASFIPVNYTSQGDIATFYTSSLNLILKITKLDFMFSHQRNMFNVDVLFNDKSSGDCFENRITIESVVAGVISNRLNDKMELDLSNFCNDVEFTDRKIHFYKLSLLAHYKIVMLRMGKDTKILNLSNNSLSQIPVEILNFFIKGDLTAIDLSNNNIPCLSELQRISSKIEKLWIEGNPLCNTVDAVVYVKNIVMKFPRLTELDGIKLNEHGIVMPFFRHYMDKPDKKTKILVDKFLHLYFAHYDSQLRSLEFFYDVNATLTISTNCSDEQLSRHFVSHSRNIVIPSHRDLKFFKNKVYIGRKAVVGVLSSFPQSIHDPSTFTVDVLKHDVETNILLLRLRSVSISARKHSTAGVWAFQNKSGELAYTPHYTKECLQACIFDPTSSTSFFALKNPDPDDIEALCNVFSYLTQLRRPEAELRLKIHGWDIASALKEFSKDMKLNKISVDRFMDDDDFSDSSSLVEEEID